MNGTDIWHQPQIHQPEDQFIFMSSSIALIRIIAAAAVVVWVRMQRVNFCRSVKTRPHSVNSEQPPTTTTTHHGRTRIHLGGVDIITNNNNNNIDNRTVQSYVVYQFLIIIKCDYKFNL